MLIYMQRSQQELLTWLFFCQADELSASRPYPGGCYSPSGLTLRKSHLESLLTGMLVLDVSKDGSLLRMHGNINVTADQLFYDIKKRPITVLA